MGSKLSDNFTSNARKFRVEKTVSPDGTKTTTVSTDENDKNLILAAGKVIVDIIRLFTKK